MLCIPGHRVLTAASGWGLYHSLGLSQDFPSSLEPVARVGIQEWVEKLRWECSHDNKHMGEGHHEGHRHFKNAIQRKLNIPNFGASKSLRTPVSNLQAPRGVKGP